jgi:hypothetical protein
MREVGPVEALVQIYRERTRAKSLLYWGREPSFQAFWKRMRSSLSGLRALTAARRTEAVNITLSEVLRVNGPRLFSANGSDTWLQIARRWCSIYIFKSRLTENFMRAALLEGRIIKDPPD